MERRKNTLQIKRIDIKKPKFCKGTFCDINKINNSNFPEYC